MRRKPGLAGLHKTEKLQQAYNAVGGELEKASVEAAKAQLESLRGVLQDFASKHRSRINSDPQFRQAFFEMCLAAGVDPLASSKGFWDDLLGVGQFSNELAVQVLHVCMQTRDLNGGLLDLGECLELVRRSRRGAQEVSERDIERAVDRLEALGRGVGIRQCSGCRLVYSVPDELNDDHAQVLELAASNGGRVSSGDLARRLGWPSERAEAALAFFVRDGLCWVDLQDEHEPRRCWFPSIALAADPTAAQTQQATRVS